MISLTYSLNNFGNTILKHCVPACSSPIDTVLPIDHMEAYSIKAVCSPPHTHLSRLSFNCVSLYNSDGRSVITQKSSAWPWGLQTARVTCSEAHMSFNFTYLSHQKFLSDGTEERFLLSFQCCWLMKTELMNRKIELRTYWYLRGLEGEWQQHPLVATIGSIQQVMIV